MPTNSRARRMKKRDAVRKASAKHQESIRRLQQKLKTTQDLLEAEKYREYRGICDGPVAEHGKKSDRAVFGGKLAGSAGLKVALRTTRERQVVAIKGIVEAVHRYGQGSVLDLALRRLTALVLPY